MNKSQWLYEMIETPYGVIHRYEMIDAFVQEGLIPFVEEHGYAWGNTSVLSEYIGTGLYLSRNKHFLESNWSSAPVYNTHYTDEDLYHFQYIFDNDAWAPFWEKWGTWIDVSLDSERGSDRRLDIQDFVWKQVNLMISEQTDVVNSIYGYDEYDEDDMHAEWAD